jgi:YggT family protein
MRSHTIEDEHLVPSRRRFVGGPIIGPVERLIDLLFSILYALLAIRFLLDLFGARPSAGFVHWVQRATEVFYAPFRGVFGTTAVFTGTIVWSLVVCIVAYMIVHAIIRGLLRFVSGW